MPTKSQLVSDIILRITKGKPSDDLELEPSQVAFWIDMVAGGLIKADLDAKLVKGKGTIDPGYICWEKELVLSKKQLTDTRYDFFIELCNEPISLNRDAGVIRINTTEGDWVDKLVMSEIDNISNLRFSSPRLDNIKYTRVGKKVYFFGLTIDTHILVKFDIAYVPKIQLLEDLEDNDDFYIGDNLLPILAEEVEKIARRQVYQSDIDEKNNAQQDLNVNGQ